MHIIIISHIIFQNNIPIHLYKNNYFPNRQRFRDICEDKINRGGITIMKDISLVNRNKESISKENIINKIQDIVWDEVFQQYFLHPQVIIFSKIKNSID